MEKVSIIVPVYNAEASLGYCLNSITSQTYTDLEIILVNDGSTDNSLQICRNYAAIDDRIIVIDIDNGGVSHARNTGLFHATGTYIEFADSDDCLAPDMVEKLVEAIECYKTDMVICGFKIIELKDSLPEKILHCTCAGLGQTCVLTKKNFFAHFAEILWKTATLEMPSNKLYRHDLLKAHRLTFPEDCSLGEDFLLNLSYFEHIKNGVVLLSKEYYYYLQTNSESLTHKYRSDLFENELMLFENVKALLRRNVQISAAEQTYLHEYMLSKAIFCMKNVINANDALTELQMKQQLAQIINNEDVRLAIEHSGHIEQSFEWLRKEYTFSDVDTIFSRITETLGLVSSQSNTQEENMCAVEMNPSAEACNDMQVISRNPGIANRVLVRILTLILKIHDNHYIAALKNTMEDYGIKAALRKIKYFLAKKRTS